MYTRFTDAGQLSPLGSSHSGSACPFSRVTESRSIPKLRSHEIELLVFINIQSFDLNKFELGSRIILRRGDVEVADH